MQRDAARFADAGRAEHGEMLAQHLVDVDVGAGMLASCCRWPTSITREPVTLKIRRSSREPMMLAASPIAG